jgi:hypothetical protein
MAVVMVDFMTREFGDWGRASARHVSSDRFLWGTAVVTALGNYQREES